MLEAPARGRTDIAVARQELRLEPDPARVVALPLNFAPAVLAERVERVLRFTDEQAGEALRDMTARFGWRHRDLIAQLRRRWAELVDLLHLDPSGVGEDRRLLAAAYTTMEYAVEAAALCNPSIVPAPDQRGAGPGELRVVVSLRAIGEGHRSTVEFRTGTVGAAGRLRLDPAGRWATPGRVTAGTDGGAGGYTVRFDPATPLDERVLYAASPDETLGLEDARFVPLQLPGGSTSWAATYTAYNGRDITIKLIRTDDFATFTVRPMTGPGVSDKGIALFPRQVGGRWWALGRQDGQRLFVMTSQDLVHWGSPQRLAEPVHDWELVQMGNCGSPVETPAGWLVVTHGVGMLRRYVMGAMLLDRDDPSVVLGRIERPLLEPDDDEREGYVPNVLYSCGGLVHEGRLVLPYAYSDRACSAASVDVEELIAAMR
ncbi:glycoside hydrolase family 130 protein [Dactylosporangium sp. NPDC050688]|uniref:glycoside hydrolase family 130 protein n=1 Tax=Dactylosporangium sp. NPDC050688 TaxID=3157217 RepID=UPI0033E431F4